MDAPDYVERFTEECLAILAGRSAIAGGSQARPGSLWLSRSTGRRASVVWSSEAFVCLSYDETRATARKIHRLQDFTRLYVEAK